MKHAMTAGPASGEATMTQWRCIVGSAFHLFFVVSTKLHGNFTENTGKALPTT